MQLHTGTVIDGKIVIHGEVPPEGAMVTILSRESSEVFDIPPELEAELLASIAEADCGEVVDLGEVLQSMRRQA